MAATTLSGAGCTRAIVSAGAIRPEPFAEILGRTETARGLRLQSEVDAHVVSSDELRDVVERAARDGWPNEGEIRDYQDSLVAMGLWPGDEDLISAFVSTLGSEAVGLYVPAERALFIVSDPRTPMSIKLASAIAGRDLVGDLTLSHELVHVLQHQAYPELVEFVTSTNNQDDVAAALQAALEGDAVFFGLRALQSPGPLPTPVDFENNLRAEAERGSLADAPDLIRKGLTFPYAKGYRLSYLETSLLLDSPPISTEQVLHDAGRREPFSAMDLSAVASKLPAGCRPIYENTMGELGISILLEELGVDVQPSAWQGWNGDRYFVARCGDDREFVWLTTWDSRVDAAEFAMAYRATAPAIATRAGYESPPHVTLDGVKVIVATAGLAISSQELDASVRSRVVHRFDDLRDFVEHDER